MQNRIRLIAFDLDETLLNSDKSLSDENREALERAAEAGILIVPATGRFLGGIPENIRSLPIRYAITMNGSEVADVQTDARLYRAYIPNERAQALMRYFDTLPVAYDCYMGGKGYIAKEFLDRIEDYIVTPVYIVMAHRNRTAVPYLPDFIAERGLPLQKLQIFTPDSTYKAALMRELALRYPDLVITTSTPENIEINAKEATKGHALKALCTHLGIPASQAMAFGDGLNDLSMLEAAGTGVAMANAAEPLKKAADYITLSNNEAGVAHAIKRFCF